jgi:hypothetical protein
MVDRREFQRTKTGLFFRQVTHPVTHGRVRITAKTEAELRARLQEVDRMRFDLRFGSAVPQ